MNMSRPFPLLNDTPVEKPRFLVLTTDGRAWIATDELEAMDIAASAFTAKSGQAFVCEFGKIIAVSVEFKRQVTATDVTYQKESSYENRS